MVLTDTNVTGQAEQGGEMIGGTEAGNGEGGGGGEQVRYFRKLFTHLPKIAREDLAKQIKEEEQVIPIQCQMLIKEINLWRIMK